MTEATVEDLDNAYLPAPECTPADGIPRGELAEFELTSAQVFAGSRRTIGVYVPAQYDGSQPACVYVALDGITPSYSIPSVFDHLIAAGEMPVTIGIGLGPGTLASADGTDPRLQRSLEFDSMNDDLARLLLQDVFPAVEGRTTASGIPLRLSRNPDDRAAGGLSTGGIGAFTLAWTRPDAFRRVCSGVGTFVGMRGGDRYPVLVRKTEPKPIRVFIQDGEHDGLPGHLDEVGDWWMSNQAMVRALTYAGYEVRHAFGRGRHSARHLAAVFPDAMRWLWAGWPTALRAGVSENTFLRAMLHPDEPWRPGTSAGVDPPHRAEASQSACYRVDPDGGSLWLDRDGTSMLLDDQLDRPSAVAVSPDGLWLAVAEERACAGLSYRILADGTVDGRQRFYVLHTGDGGPEPATRGWVFDRHGTLLAATPLGVQVFDRNGRVRAIVPSPDGSPLTGIGFDPTDLMVLRVHTRQGNTFDRRLRVGGVALADRPVALPEWAAG